MTREEWEAAYKQASEKQIAIQKLIDGDIEMLEANERLYRAAEKSESVRRNLQKRYKMEEAENELYRLLDLMPPR